VGYETSVDYRQLPQRIEEAAAIDPIVDTLRTVVNSAIPSPEAKKVLAGEWLGHAVHPLLTDLPIGFWTSAWVLDLVGGRSSRDASRRLVGLGVLAALPTIATGLSDWADLEGQKPRRVGVAHAAANATALVAYGASWRARRQGRHLRGVALGMVGATAATVGGYLGGHLVFG
jgi:uncharacterized membrane protein